MTEQTNPGHELSITRHIDAPPETVYRVWTERTGEWWAPKPYTTPAVELDLRAGGRCFTHMKGPDGFDMPHEGVFLEVVPNEKIVFTDGFKAGWMPSGDDCAGNSSEPFMVAIVTFAREGSGTRYTARVRHWKEEKRKQHEEMGFTEGWGIVAGQLAALAEAEAKGATAPAREMVGA